MESELKLANIIAIDGPAASGKSTLGLRLAQELGFLYFDTGVMYRALTWAVLAKDMDALNEPDVTALAGQVVIDVRQASVNDGRACDVLVDGRDVSWEIRTPQVEAHVSAVSAYAGVRTVMKDAQRLIGLRGRVVMVGRDIGTVVLPEAGLKIYLDASVEERARRRFSELQSRGDPAAYETILAAMKKRDQIDSTRAVAPLRPADDAVMINSDGMSVEQVVDQVRSLLPK
jgi:cytidylate kinase